jgi:hypothetical protein
MRMKIVIAIELIFGAIFVVWFWYQNPVLRLSRGLSHPQLDPCDDEENDDARAHPSNFLQLRHSGLAVFRSVKDPRS